MEENAPGKTETLVVDCRGVGCTAAENGETRFVPILPEGQGLRTLVDMLRDGTFKARCGRIIEGPNGPHCGMEELPRSPFSSPDLRRTAPCNPFQWYPE